PGLILSGSSINEGGAVNVQGFIVSPGGTDTNTVVLDWGDGLASTTIVLHPGQDFFSASHTYPNNPRGVAAKNYTIHASVTNQDYKIATTSATVAVHEVAPQITELSVPASANEGDTITLSGQFTDPDPNSTYTMTIDWGDGSTPTDLVEFPGQIVPSTLT